MAGATVLDDPLFIYGRAVSDGCVIRNGQVTDESQVVEAFFRIYCWDNRGQWR